ncbi:hypothetical protein T10_2361 [Trichinella papuae]|uniref:Uncharacterized protein n=1 Tax=Trichinella papuae TaxID=268474 RepID=A0A0V1M1L1_9BILA|nr:hypothetical protein T10_2361 [Trichinella papuae]
MFLGAKLKSERTPVRMSPRMTHWSIRLSAYDYNLIYHPGMKLGNANAFSRLPQTGNQIQHIAERRAKMWSAHVQSWLHERWPAELRSEDFKAFHCRSSLLFNSCLDCLYKYNTGYAHFHSTIEEILHRERKRRIQHDEGVAGSSYAVDPSSLQSDAQDNVCHLHVTSLTTMGEDEDAIVTSSHTVNVILALPAATDS